MRNKKRTVLALDLGRSAGRAVLADYENESLKTEEIYKFPIEPVACQGELYWNILGIFQEIKYALRKAAGYGGFDSVGIDAWGADYALIDRRGALLGNPVQYQNTGTENFLREAEKFISPDRLHLLTGCGIRPENTVFRLLQQKINAPELLTQAQAFLLMPDLFAYLLTGDISSELSIAGTTQLCSPYSGGWSGEMIKALGLPEHIFPAMAQTGTVKGMLSEEICRELEINSVPVIAVCGHNIQCAAAAVPALDQNSYAFLHCDTQAVLGTELSHMIINAETASAGISNTIGLEHKILFDKPITGTGLLHEVRQALKKQGKDYQSYDLEKLAESAESCQRFIDIAAPAFSSSEELLVKFRDWCSESGQPAPADIADILRAVYESLACRFREVLEELQACSGQKFEKLYLLGEGVKDRLLCQLTADACQIPVCTGAETASAYGNAMIQLIVSGAVPDLFEARWLTAKAVRSRTYQPQNPELYHCYQEIFHP